MAKFVLNPIRGVQNLSDSIVIFLQKFIDWLVKNIGFLSKDTYQVIFQSPTHILELIKLSWQNFKVKYFLPGKIETDNLEGSFAKYRRLISQKMIIVIFYKEEGF